MIGQLNMISQRGERFVSDVEVTNRGVNPFEVQAKLEQLKSKMDNPLTPVVAFLQLPSKMNFRDFVIDDEGPL